MPWDFWLFDYGFVCLFIVSGCIGILEKSVRYFQFLRYIWIKQCYIPTECEYSQEYQMSLRNNGQSLILNG